MGLRLSDEALEFWAKNGEIIRRVAEREHKASFLFEVDDIEQHLYAEFLANMSSCKKLDEGSVEYLASKKARHYCAKERDDYMYFTGQFVYTPKLVRSILETSMWKGANEVEDVDGHVDVQAAFNKLVPSHKKAVFKRYGTKAENLTETEKRYARLAVDRMATYLNHRLQMEAGDIEQA